MSHAAYPPHFMRGEEVNKTLPRHEWVVPARVEDRRALLRVVALAEELDVIVEIDETARPRLDKLGVTRVRRVHGDVDAVEPISPYHPERSCPSRPARAALRRSAQGLACPDDAHRRPGGAQAHHRRTRHRGVVVGERQLGRVQASERVGELDGPGFGAVAVPGAQAHPPGHAAGSPSGHVSAAAGSASSCADSVSPWCASSAASRT